MTEKPKLKEHHTFCMVCGDFLYSDPGNKYGYCLTCFNEIEDEINPEPTEDDVLFVELFVTNEKIE